MAEKKISLDLEIKKGNAEKTAKSIKQELREAKEEAFALSRKFGELSPEAVAATKKLAGLRDEMEDLNKAVQGLNPDKFARLSTLTNGVVRGFQAAQGAAVLFGKTGEDIEKSIAKLQATMALADGVQGVMDARKQFSSFFQEVVTGYKKMIVAVNGFSTASKIALAATGIGLIVVALASIVAYWEEITVAIQGANSEQAKSQKLYEQSKQLLNDRLQTHKDTHAQQILAGKTEKEILETEIKITEQLLQQEELKLSIQEKELKRAVAEREKLGKTTAGLIYMWGMWKTPEEIKAAGELGLADQRKSIEAAKENLAKSKLAIEAIETAADEKRKANAKRLEDEINAAKNEANDERLRFLIEKRDREIETERNLARIRKQIEDDIAKSDKAVKERQMQDIADFNSEAIKGVEERNKLTAELNEKHRQEQIAKEKAYEENLKALKMQGANAVFDLLYALNKQRDGATEAQQKKAFDRNKALQIAETTMSTYSAAQSAYQSQMTIPSPDAPLRAAIAAGIAIASGLARVIAISKTQFNSTSTSISDTQGGRGQQVASTGFSVVAKPTNQNMPTNSSIKPEPVRVYVVQKDLDKSKKQSEQIKVKSIVK